MVRFRLSEKQEDLKIPVSPYNMYDNTGNGFTFDRYESGLLYDAINRAKTLYFESRKYWDDMVIRDMNKDVSWEKSAKTIQRFVCRADTEKLKKYM